MPHKYQKNMAFNAREGNFMMSKVHDEQGS